MLLPPRHFVIFGQEPPPSAASCKMSDTPPGKGGGSPGTSQGKRPLSWGDAKHSKRSPSKTAGVRTFTFGAWKDSKTTPGPYCFVNINGSKHNIARNFPLLGAEEPHSLLLSGYFDVGWSGKHSSHSFKSTSKQHAERIMERIKETGKVLRLAVRRGLLQRAVEGAGDEHLLRQDVEPHCPCRH